MVHAHPRAKHVVIRLLGGAASAQQLGDGPAERLRAWCTAQITSNLDMAAVSRRYGARYLLVCTGLLAAALFLSWALVSEEFFGEPTAFRTLLSEAVVIAGWVVMWRPLEMLLFDPLRPTLEARLLRRLLDTPIEVEAPAPTEPAGDAVASAPVHAR